MVTLTVSGERDVILEAFSGSFPIPSKKEGERET